MADTPLTIEARMARMMAAKTPVERLRMASSMFDAGRKLVEAGLRHKNNALSEAQLRAQMFLRIYGNDFSKAEIEKIMRSIPNMQADTE